MNKVELFTADTQSNMETLINKWCERNFLEPISISMTINQFGEYVAAVVVRECEHG